MLESSLNKVAGLRAVECFPVKLSKFFRTPYLEEHLRMTTSVSSCNFIYTARKKIQLTLRD